MFDPAFDGVAAEAAARMLRGTDAADLGQHGEAMTQFWLAAVAYDRLDDPAGTAVAAARFGESALEMGEFPEAEEALTTAEATFRYLERDDDVARVRMVLGRVRFATGSYRTAVAQLQKAIDHFSPKRDRPSRLEWARATADLAEVELAQNNLRRASKQLGEALEVFIDCGSTDDEFDARIALASVRGSSIVDAEADLLEARAHFATRRRTDRVADVDFRLSALYSGAGDFTKADAAFDAAADGLRAARQYHQLANLQWNRAERYRAESDSREDADDQLTGTMIDSAVSAVVAADFERFQFVDVGRRVEWAHRLRTRLASSFALAHDAGRMDVVADLIEWAINRGVHGDEEPATVGPDFEAFDKRRVARRRVDGRRDDVSSNPIDLTMGAANLLDNDELPLAPPPTLLAENDRVILHRQRSLAASLDPELRDAMASAPTVEAW